MNDINDFYTLNSISAIIIASSAIFLNITSPKGKNYLSEMLDHYLLVFGWLII